MLTINYFASIRETLGKPSETLELPAGATDVSALVDHLIARDPACRAQGWDVLEDSQRVLVAVDQTVVPRNFPLKGNEEVAFFPPMTGG